MINKIVRKSMMKKKSLIFSIVILIIISSLFLSVSHLTYDTLTNNYNEMLKQTNVEDFSIYTISGYKDKYTDELISSVEEDNNITLEEKEQYNYTPQDGGLIYNIKEYDSQEVYNQIILDEGELPDGENEAVVLPHFLLENNLSIGDSINVGDYQYEIVGTAYFPEWIVPIDQTTGMFTPDLTKFAPIYVDSESFAQLKSDENFIYSLKYSGQFNDELTAIQKEEVYDQIEDVENYNVAFPLSDENGNPQLDENFEVITKEYLLFPYVQDLEMNFNINGVENEVQGSKTMFLSIAIILMLMTLFLTVILVNSVFKSQRREMGIMKAEGVSIAKLSFGFGIFIFLLTTISSFIGFLLGIPASHGMLSLYDDMFQIYDYPILNSVYTTVLIELLISVLVITISVYFVSIRKNLNQKTLNLIKNIGKDKLPKHRFKFFSRKLSFLRKYQFNIIVRNFSKTLLLTFGVFVSAMLFLLGTLMYTAISEMQNSTFTETFNYSYTVYYSNDYGLEEDENSYISTSVNLVSVPNEGELENPITDETTFTLESYKFDENDYVNLTNDDGEKISSDDGLVATSGFMKQYNLEIGDEIVFKNPYNVDEEITLPIVEVTDDFFLPYVYADLDYFQETLSLENNFVNSEYYGEELTNEIKNDIKEVNPQARILEIQDMDDAFGDSLSIIISFILIIWVLASIIAFVSLYAISSIIIDSNKKTISIMKVMGYTNSEIKKMTVGIYKWFVIVIYIGLIPIVEAVIKKIVNVATQDLDFTLDINLNYVTAFIGLIVILIVYLISERLAYRSIYKIKLAESLKADE